jgi:hypothetical protein
VFFTALPVFVGLLPVELPEPDPTAVVDAGDTWTKSTAKSWPPTAGCDVSSSV